ncbi:MAG TPA: imidazolonepropionase [Pyrinomonadaceae bacterium]|nr:imidazolonepropionase [Pyrinomonadaceae bacterium]
MKNCDLIIYGASQLLTCASNGKAKKGAEMSQLHIIENGAIAVFGEKIAAVGKTEDILREFQAKKTIDANGKVVSPGFVECHTHLVFAGNRLNEFELKIKGADYLEILKNGGGILSTVHHTREANFKDLVEDARKRLDKMLAFGITTCEIKTGYGLDTETEFKMLEAILELDRFHAIEIIPTFMPAHTIPFEDYRKKNQFLMDEIISEDYTSLICDEMLPKLRDWRENVYIDVDRVNFDYTRNKPFFVDVFCEKNAFTLEQSRRILETAKSLGFKLKAHVDQFTNLGGTTMAIELGAVSIDHLDAISEIEIGLLANSDTIGVTTPTCNFNFGETKFTDARKLIDAGCAMAVSTDYNPGSAPCPSITNAMAIACRYQKLPPAEVFNAATINAAFAVGLGEKIGSLEAGKQADILIFDTNDYRETIYEFGGNFVEKIIKNGRIIEN